MRDALKSGSRVFGTRLHDVEDRNRGTRLLDGERIPETLIPS